MPSHPSGSNRHWRANHQRSTTEGTNMREPRHARRLKDMVLCTKAYRHLGLARANLNVAPEWVDVTAVAPATSTFSPTGPHEASPTVNGNAIIRFLPSVGLMGGATSPSRRPRPLCDSFPTRRAACQTHTGGRRGTNCGSTDAWCCEGRRHTCDRQRDAQPPRRKCNCNGLPSGGVRPRMCFCIDADGDHQCEPSGQGITPPESSVTSNTTWFCCGGRCAAPLCAIFGRLLGVNPAPDLLGPLDACTAGQQTQRGRERLCGTPPERRDVPPLYPSARLSGAAAIGDLINLIWPVMRAARNTTTSLHGGKWPHWQAADRTQRLLPSCTASLCLLFGLFAAGLPTADLNASYGPRGSTYNVYRRGMAHVMGGGVFAPGTQGERLFDPARATLAWGRGPWADHSALRHGTGCQTCRLVIDAHGLGPSTVLSVIVSCRRIGATRLPLARRLWSHVRRRQPTSLFAHHAPPRASDCARRDHREPDGHEFPLAGRAAGDATTTPTTTSTYGHDYHHTAHVHAGYASQDCYRRHLIIIVCHGYRDADPYDNGCVVLRARVRSPSDVGPTFVPSSASLPRVRSRDASERPAACGGRGPEDLTCNDATGDGGGCRHHGQEQSPHEEDHQTHQLRAMISYPRCTPTLNRANLFSEIGRITASGGPQPLWHTSAAGENPRCPNPDRGIGCGIFPRRRTNKEGDTDDGDVDAAAPPHDVVITPSCPARGHYQHHPRRRHQHHQHHHRHPHRPRCRLPPPLPLLADLPRPTLDGEGAARACAHGGDEEAGVREAGAGDMTNHSVFSHSQHMLSTPHAEGQLHPGRANSGVDETMSDADFDSDHDDDADIGGRPPPVPTVADDGGGTDHGGGVWQWLHDDAPPPPPPCARLQVDYHGSVGLLDLRGGGTADTDTDAAPRGRRPAEHNDDDDPPLFCSVCNHLMFQDGEDWASCICGRLFCESCMARPCPCRTPTEEATCHRQAPSDALVLDPGDIRVGSVRRLVDHFEAENQPRRAMPGLAQTSARDDDWQTIIAAPRDGRSGVTMAPWACITGERHGRPVRICPQCNQCREVDDTTWQPRRDGLVICRACAHGLHGGDEQPTSHGELAPATTPPPQMSEVSVSYAGAQSHLQTSNDHPSSTGQTPPRVCGCCSLDLAAMGSSWRICTCGVLLCDGCWNAYGSCPPCRGEMPTACIAESGSAEHVMCAHIADDDSSYCSISDSVYDQPQAVTDATGFYGRDLRQRWLSPSQAEELRSSMMRNLAERRRERRVRTRDLAKEQVKRGVRPPRPPLLHRATFLTLNPNCAARLRDEVQSGDLFRGVDIGFVQEHREAGEGLDKLVTWLRGRGWDPAPEGAYIKKTDYGGGTLVMANGAGLRPLPPPPESLQGRIAWAETDLNGSVLCAAIYALSGQGAAKQLHLLRHVVQRVVTYGLPCVLGGDWQIPPQELRDTGVLRLIDAEIVSAGLPTNVASGRELDYFVVSKALLGEGATAEIDPSGAFSPHVAVRLVLPLPRENVGVRSLRQPRPLPVTRPIGPLQVPEFIIDWENWDSARRKGEQPDNDSAPLAGLTREWFAGAEVELIEAFGMNYDEGEQHWGLGQAAVTIQSRSRGRFRNVADELGLVGQRLSWTAKALWTIIAAMGSVIGSEHRNRFLGIAAAMAPRARAFRRELQSKPQGSLDKTHTDILITALHAVGRADLQVHGVIPLLTRLKYVDSQQHLIRFRELYNTVNTVLLDVASLRRKRAVQATRQWARTVSDKQAHRATKKPEVAILKSASADKHHRGEMSDQSAADQGIAEWGGIWLANEGDACEEVRKQVQEIYDRADACDFSAVILPPLTGEALRRAALRFRSDTAVGVDGIRPRHIARLSPPALDALAHLLALFERQRQWADTLREVIEVSRTKKSGGGRLVGLGASLYRLWARTRFEHVRAVMEQRVERPYLPAAPGKGAVRAVFDMSLTVEAARASGHVAATTGYDLKKYYEHITVAELARGAKRFGLPLQITSLLAQLYVGPRRIRVGRAVSRAVYPRRSLLAGCTFALLAIRMITIGPVEQLMELIKARFRRWTATVFPTFYVDDGVITTTGQLDAVALLHGWVSRLVLNWVKKVLHKDIAPHKSSCIVSCRRLRDRIWKDMLALGITPRLEGEMLGIDYSAGGPLRTRASQKARRSKAMGRRSRIAWLRRAGGPAKRVARQGALPEHSYGSEVNGLPPAALRDARRINAASSAIQCGGSSLTAKLALGGEAFGEHDPAVLHHNPPLKLLLMQIWDVPRRRETFVRAWYGARESIPRPDGNPNWANVNGPVSAAMAQLLRIGATWPRAFTIVALGQPVDILRVPPRTVMRILSVHARRHYDHVMLRRWANEFQWDADAIHSKYQHGIDWQLLRESLLGKGNQLNAKEKRVLLTVATGAFWPEERRWAAGLSKSAICTACGIEAGSQRHRIHDCGATAADRALGRAAGIHRRLPVEANDQGLVPLLLMALPPLPVLWQPEDISITEGDMAIDTVGPMFGDGSGYHQNLSSCRVSSWSLVSLDPESPAGGTVRHKMAGSVIGWDQTVPRAELTALIKFLTHSSAGAYFVGDCRYVIDGAASGVPPSLMTSNAADPDLWKEVHRLILDHGAPPHLVKVKAHRSVSRAAIEGEESILHWHGNDAADRVAKSLCRRRLLADFRADDHFASTELSRRIIDCVARGASLAVDKWPDIVPSANQQVSQGRGALASVGDDDFEENHQMRRTERGYFECSACKQIAYTVMGARRMRTAPCGGSIGHATHQTHRIHTSQGVVWCGACGAFAARWPRQLIQVCPRRPRSQAQRNVLRRLWAGLPPTTASYLAEAARADGIPVGSVDVVTDAARGHPRGPAEARLDITSSKLGQQSDGHDGHGHDHSGEHGVTDDDAPRLPVPPAAAPPIPPVGASIDTRATISTPSDGRPEGFKHCYWRLEEQRARRRAHSSPQEARVDDQQRPSVQIFNVTSGAGRAAGPCVVDKLDAGCRRLTTAGHWSLGVAIGQSRLPSACTACGGMTRLRCRHCRAGLCLDCVRARRSCGTNGPSAVEPGVATSAGSNRPCDHRSPRPRSQDAAAIISHQPGKRMRGKGPLPQAASSHHRGADVFHHHHHASVAVDEAPNPTPCGFSAAPSGNCHHQRHHHHGNPEGSAPAQHAACHLAGEGESHSMGHSEGSGQRNVVLASLLTDTVLPLSQGVVLSVDVAAEAAEESVAHASPSSHLDHHAEGFTECQGGRLLTSTSAAAALAS